MLFFCSGFKIMLSFCSGFIFILGIADFTFKLIIFFLLKESFTPFGTHSPILRFGCLFAASLFFCVKFNFLVDPSHIKGF
jgi:hypothetical protein